MSGEMTVGTWRDLKAGITDAMLVPVPIPPLIGMLVHFQHEKGADLTEPEVLAYRDNAVCMVMNRDTAEQMAAARGYADLDMENVWSDWQAFLAQERET
jgi:hypothetical protein